MHIIIATWFGLMRHWHTGRSMHCVPAQVCMRPFPSDAGKVGWCMHVCKHLVNVHYGHLACNIWLHIAMFCARVVGLQEHACECALQPLICNLWVELLPGFVTWLVGLQE